MNNALTEPIVLELTTAKERPTMYLVIPSLHIYAVADSDLAAYLAAGWVQPTAAQCAQWQTGDPYLGTQGYPPAPPLIKPGLAPPPQIEINHGPMHARTGVPR